MHPCTDQSILELHEIISTVAHSFTATLSTNLLQHPPLIDETHQCHGSLQAPNAVHEPEQESFGEEKDDSLYPSPLRAFKELSAHYGISAKLVKNILNYGYQMPTPVQSTTLPLLLEGPAYRHHGKKWHRHSPGTGSHLITIAPTGSGKTLAFLIPIFSSLYQERYVQLKENPSSTLKEDGPYAVVLAPTKELAYQIANEGRKLALNTGIRISVMTKGMRIGSTRDGEEAESEDNDEETGAGKCNPNAPVVKSHVLVSTPMAMLNALREEDGSVIDLKSTRFLVLDEADILLDPLFREQTIAVCKAHTSPSLRVSLWSATMSSSIQELAESLLTPHPGPTFRIIIGLQDSALPTISHKLTYCATEQGKLLALRQLLAPTAPSSRSNATQSLRPPFLIFTQTIARAKALHAELRYDIPAAAGGSSRIAALHSELPDRMRSRIMADFRRGEIWVIITTDLMARGLDFAGLNGVVNYDVPNSAATYVHRAGRTGRAGREGGVAVTLFTEADVPYVRSIANVIRTSEKAEGKEVLSVPDWLMECLPAPSKQAKKDLKLHGVKERRSGKEAMISTKSSYDRRARVKKMEMRGAKGRVGKSRALEDKDDQGEAAD
ncbi:P-loop containing nucleoside triphosphate hydrolase protein [Trichodelitschia bisporula]|uniref:ATP-dependent RNA helicase ROK1 n=1 Tax=Trichodelitschia bisporula TaxID=703511 RepID=A0A6G1I0P8_9PEZI|nr:P-loop containing nucleoside triphosphate hydrolase protein [Trichodelitschia bisporula]